MAQKEQSTIADQETLKVIAETKEEIDNLSVAISECTNDAIEHLSRLEAKYAVLESRIKHLLKGQVYNGNKEEN